VFNFSNTTLARGRADERGELPFRELQRGEHVPGQMCDHDARDAVEPYPTVSGDGGDADAQTTTVRWRRGTAGAFTTYTVELAPYDLFPQLRCRLESHSADESADGGGVRGHEYAGVTGRRRGVWRGSRA